MAFVGGCIWHIVRVDMQHYNGMTSMWTELACWLCGIYLDRSENELFIDCAVCVPWCMGARSVEHGLRGRSVPKWIWIAKRVVLCKRIIPAYPIHSADALVCHKIRKLLDALRWTLFGIASSFVSQWDLKVESFIQCVCIHLMGERPIFPELSLRFA